MLKIKKSVITAHTPAQIYALVSDIENYNNYLPWCSKSAVLSQQGNEIVGRVDIEYLKIKTHFTTKNKNTLNEKIEFSLVDGPFKEFKGCWQFIPLGENGCKIEFQLDYQFSNPIIAKLVGAVFDFAIKNIVESFIKKANTIYPRLT